MMQEAPIEDTKVFGFWLYLMTDLVIFAALFATYVVLRDSTFGGPSGHDLFEIRTALFETMILLTSSFTCSLATLAVYKNQKNQILLWLALTFLLGSAFLALEIAEFIHFVSIGASWSRSGFLSAFFTLVGTHGFHISCGLLWMLVAMFRVFSRPLSSPAISQLFRLAFFWHFLDVVWIFIFSVVYALGILYA
jgi:cytochrome o ubiquinol oxidase subunit 3